MSFHVFKRNLKLFFVSQSSTPLLDLENARARNAVTCDIFNVAKPSLNLDNIKSITEGFSVQRASCHGKKKWFGRKLYWKILYEMNEHNT